MSPIERVIGDVLDAQTEALVIGCDGDHPKMISSVGHQLRKRLDDDQEWGRIIEKARFPILPGAVRGVDVMEIPEIPFRYLLFVNLYNHHDPETYLKGGYYNALVTAYNGRVRSLAMVLHRGGWRVRYNSGDALKSLEESSARFPDIRILLYERPPR